MLFLLNRYGTAKGILISLLAAYLLLPAGFGINFPGIPALNKYTLTSMVLLAYLIFTKQPTGYKELRGWHKFVFLMLMVSPFLTSLTNQERYLFIQGLSLYDGLSQAGIGFLHFFPFLLGLAYFNTYERQVVLLRFVAIAAIMYCVLVLWEIRMSPQLHVYLYGYFPHSFLQQYREGGFRAVVFLGHGLIVAMFLAVGFASLFAVHKAKIRAWRFDNRLLLFLLMATIVLQKSYGAIVYALIVIVMVGFFSYRKIHLLSVAIATMFLTYPVTSSMGIFPHQQIVNAAVSVSPERAQSVGFRFEHESILLEHALKKPLFGWGSWGRNRVYDLETGADLSVTDGNWVITLGTGGWMRFVGLFYFVVMAIYLAYRSQKYLRGAKDEKNRQLLMSIHSLVVALILMDQMPNSSLHSLYWLIIGSLFGRCVMLKSQKNHVNTSTSIEPN
ncbi:MAG: O-antigen ligase family protein [Methylophaga sp.]|nr:O-antigen ligase family protein [Methylophaga sp.]